MAAAICKLALDHFILPVIFIFGLRVIPQKQSQHPLQTYIKCARRDQKGNERALNHSSFSQWDSVEPWGLLGMRVCEGRRWDPGRGASCGFSFLSTKHQSSIWICILSDITTLWLFMLHGHRGHQAGDRANNSVTFICY